MKLSIPLAAAMAVVLPMHATAATTNFVANLTELSGSGVSGIARLAYDDVAMTLGVRINATGLEQNQIHVQHIHGRFNDNGTPRDSVSPTFAAGADTDGDGFAERLIVALTAPVTAVSAPHSMTKLNAAQWLNHTTDAFSTGSILTALRR